MGALKKHTATKAEMAAIEKAVNQGVPTRVIAEQLNIHEDKILRFVSPKLKARVIARERLEAKAAKEEEKQMQALRKETAKVEKELLK